MIHEELLLFAVFFLSRSPAKNYARVEFLSNDVAKLIQ